MEDKQREERAKLIEEQMKIEKKLKEEAEKAKAEAVKSEVQALNARDEAEKAKEEAVKSEVQALKAKDDAEKAKLAAIKSEEQALKAKEEAEKAEEKAIKSESKAKKNFYISLCLSIFAIAASIYCIFLYLDQKDLTKLRGELIDSLAVKSIKLENTINERNKIEAVSEAKELVIYGDGYMFLEKSELACENYKDALEKLEDYQTDTLYKQIEERKLLLNIQLKEKKLPLCD